LVCWYKGRPCCQSFAPEDDQCPEMAIKQAGIAMNEVILMDFMHKGPVNRQKGTSPVSKADSTFFLN
jgi:hypothetical protein